MRIVALEEHFVIPELAARLDAALDRRDGNASSGAARARGGKQRELAELGRARIADMDATGITLQVLSMPGGGAELLDGAAGVAFARDYNDALGRAVARHPGRLAGFAHLPMRSPDAAADELERTVRNFDFHGALISGLRTDDALIILCSSLSLHGRPRSTCRSTFIPALWSSRCDALTMMACPDS